MKALVYQGAETLAFEEATDPIPAAHEHLIRVDAVGICGSDMHAYLGHDERRPAPLILGHEAAGTIVGGSKDGLRVTINPLVSCKNCPACQAERENLCGSRQIISMPPREGAFAQYVTMPERNLVPVPDGFSIEKAALVEPLAVSWHAARLALAAAPAIFGSEALVIGGGAIGLAAALALKAQGAEEVTIVEPNAARRAFLTEHCTENAVAEVSAAYPIVIDAVGIAPTRALASARAIPGGVIAHVGLGDSEGGLDIRRMTLQEITFIGTYTYTAADFVETAHALFDGRLGPTDWIATRPLADGAAAFRDIRAGAVAEPKTVLLPWN